MKLYFEMLKLIFNKYIRKYNNGKLIKEFCEDMGVVYIKLAQMLSTQSFGNLFTEEDKKILSGICSDCKYISFKEIKKIIEKEYNKPIDELFEYIEEKPIGAASISQVHKAKLKNGDIVALKIKRKNVTSNVNKQIKQIKKLMHLFGKFLKFGNFVGFDRALNLYLSWIYQETDFENEVKNLKTYNSFANTVNGKIEGNKNIKVPKIYPELCNNNIIAMEFIEHKTIDKLELNEENIKKIKDALNSYISSSLYAMFNDLKIVFHGDPHSGNIYIDENGDMGFLDMGLIFELPEQDMKLTKELFFAAYKRDSEKIYNLAIPYSNLSEEKKNNFKKDIEKYCNELKNKPATSYFTDLMNICLKYEVCPPNFLFCLAKAFICLDGINTISKNDISGTDLLKEQVIEYYIRKTLKETDLSIIEGLTLFPKVLLNTGKYGLVRGFTKNLVQSNDLKNRIKQTLESYKEILDIMFDNEDFEPYINKTLKK